jgi:hypothetical protein
MVTHLMEIRNMDSTTLPLLHFVVESMIDNRSDSNSDK